MEMWNRLPGLDPGCRIGGAGNERVQAGIGSNIEYAARFPGILRKDGDGRRFNTWPAPEKNLADRIPAIQTVFYRQSSRPHPESPVKRIRDIPYLANPRMDRAAREEAQSWIG
jgi:hypothetical protein